MFSHWDLSVLAFVLTKAGVEMQKPLKRRVSMCKRLRWTKQNNETNQQRKDQESLKDKARQISIPLCLSTPAQRCSVAQPLLVFPAGSGCLHWEPGAQMLNILLEEAEANSGNQGDLPWNFLSISLIPVMRHRLSSVLVVSGHWSNSGSLLQEGRVSLHLLRVTCSCVPASWTLSSPLILSQHHGHSHSHSDPNLFHQHHIPVSDITDHRMETYLSSAAFIS